MTKAIMIHARDNTATLFGKAEPGEAVTVVRGSGEMVHEIAARQSIPVGHKIALEGIGKGDKILKYGETIGVATQTIQKGDHVHVQNVVGAVFPGRPIRSGREPLMK